MIVHTDADDYAERAAGDGASNACRSVDHKANEETPSKGQGLSVIFSRDGGFSRKAEISS